MWIHAYKNMDTYSMCNMKSDWHASILSHQMQYLAVNVNLKAATSNTPNDGNHF